MFKSRAAVLCCSLFVLLGCQAVATDSDGPALDFGQDLTQDLVPPPDLTRVFDLMPPPDLAPRSCVFDRDCMDSASQCCGNRCTKFLDRKNCGRCGVSCGLDLAIECCGDGKNAYCADLRKDLAHCGMCNAVCVVAGGCCDGECRNIKDDPKNCGICAKTCPQGRFCSMGECR